MVRTRSCCGRHRGRPNILTRCGWIAISVFIIFAVSSSSFDNNKTKRRSCPIMFVSSYSPVVNTVTRSRRTTTSRHNYYGNTINNNNNNDLLVFSSSSSIIRIRIERRTTALLLSRKQQQQQEYDGDKFIVFEGDEDYEELAEGMEASKPSDFVIVKRGINIFTYILGFLIILFAGLNLTLGPGWLGNTIGIPGTGTFEEVSKSLPDNIDLSNPDYLL